MYDLDLRPLIVSAMLELWNIACSIFLNFFPPFTFIYNVCIAVELLSWKTTTKVMFFESFFFPFLLLLKLTMWTTAYRTFFTVYHTVKMLTELGVLFTVFFLTKTVDNVALLSGLLRKKDDIHCEMILLIMYLYYL